MWREQIILVSLFVLAFCKSDFRRQEEHERKGRFITFNTVDDDVKVDLQFSIPFLTIPAKRAMDTVYGMWTGDYSPININPATLAVSGALLVTTTVLVPLVYKYFSHHQGGDRYSRLLDSQFSGESLLELASKMLSDGRSAHGCALRIACWTAQAHKEQIHFWDQISRNTLVSSIVNASAIDDAIYSGAHGRDCSYYTPCPVTEEHVPFLINYLSIFSNSIG